MQDIAPVLKVQDIMKIFGISQPTVYRWIAASRTGTGNGFPLPIGSYRQKLSWSRESIEEFMQSKNVPQPLVNTSSPSRQKARQVKTVQERSVAVEQALARHGISTSNKKGA